MNNRGFSLMELLIVITLIGILSALGTFAFSQYSKKSQMATQTRLLYGDLMEYRVKALYEKKNWTFKMSAAKYEIYSSAATAVTPVTTVALKHPVEFKSTPAPPIEFDTQGVIPLADANTVCVASANDSVVDSVVISRTRVQIGKRKAGTDCDPDNIVAQ